jgi:hypothetical protein
MSALSTSHKPLRVTPSLTLSPVSLKDKTGAGSLTDPALGAGVGWEGTDEPQLLTEGEEPGLTQATETKAAASTTTTCKFFRWRNNMAINHW